MESTASDRPVGAPEVVRWTSVLTPPLAAAFIGIVVVLVATLAVGLLNLERVYGTGEIVAHTYTVKAALDEMLSTMVDAETGQRGFIITGTAAYLDPYERAVGAISPAIARVRTLIVEPDQQADLD